MRTVWLFAAMLMAFASTTFAQSTAVTDVNVIPMDSERVLTDQVVVVEDGKITGIGPETAIEVPDGSTIIQGQGGYLMPGLADMHMHLVGDFTYRDPEQLLFFLSQGTTTIRVLGAPPIALKWREDVLSGDVVGPRIYAMGPTLIGNYDDEMGFGSILLGFNVARFVVPVLLALVFVVVVRRYRSRRGFLIAGLAGATSGAFLVATEQPPLNILNPVFDAPQAHAFEDRVSPLRSVIRSYRARGFDGVKLYDGLSEAQLLSAADEATRQGLYSTGHLLNHVPLETQLSSGMREVAHVDEFLSHHWIGYNLGQDPDPRFSEIQDYPVDPASIPATVELVTKNGVSVVSNLSTDEALYRLLLDLEGTLAEPRFGEFRQDYVQGWKTRGRHLGPFAGQGEHRRDVFQPFLSALVKALHDAGVLVTIGTDAGGFTPEGSIPSDIHRELELLVEAGFTNFEALAAGTRSAGRIIGEMGGGRQGTLTVGSAADLILLTSNPLVDVSATRERAGVMVSGRWFAQEDLNRLVADYQSSRDW
ncbi:MAG: amidohydrolase family protein [Paracoccaceae bacterium]|nr:amidohydrolase family protein [Paracoccaceae bacterium]